MAKWSDAGLHCVGGIAFHNTTRQAETLRSAAILGYDARFMEQGASMTQWILDLLDELRPQVLLVHPENDPHPEHQSVHQHTIAALTKCPHRRSSPLRWYAFDSYYQTRTAYSWPLAVDITHTMDRKLNALAQHASQGSSELDHMAIHAAAMVGMRVRVKYAEAFHPFDLLGRWPVLRELP